MAFTQGYGLAFPTRDDPEGGGGFLAVTRTLGETVRANLLLLVTTRKGTRWRRPSYGCSQVHRIFEPNDDVGLEEITLDVRQAVEEWLPQVAIAAITQERTARGLVLHLYFEYNEGALRKREVLDIEAA